MKDHPDDTEVNNFIRDAEDPIEALWEISEKYEMNLTNNLPRWQDGVYLREVAEFIGDIRAVYAKFPYLADMDSKDPGYINYWKRGVEK